MRAVGLGGSIKSGSCTTAHLDPSRGAEQTGIHSVVQDISHRLSRAKKLFVHQSEQSFVAGAQVGLAKTRRAWNGSCAGDFFRIQCGRWYACGTNAHFTLGSI